MQLTPYAESIMPALEATLDNVEHFLDQKTFDLERAEDTIIVSTADFLSMLLLPEIHTRVQQNAPKLSIHSIPIDEYWFNGLKSSDIDFVIGPMSIFHNTPFPHANLFSDRMVFIGCEKHTELQSISLNKMKNRTFVSHGARSDPLKSFISSEHEHIKHTLNSSICTSTHLLIPFLVMGTTSLAMVQEKFAKELIRFLPLSIIEIEEELPTFEIAMAWNPRKTTDPLSKWVRSNIIDIAAARLAPIGS